MGFFQEKMIEEKKKKKETTTEIKIQEVGESREIRIEKIEVGIEDTEQEIKEIENLISKTKELIDLTKPNTTARDELKAFIGKMENLLKWNYDILEEQKASIEHIKQN